MTEEDKKIYHQTIKDLQDLRNLYIKLACINGFVDMSYIYMNYTKPDCLKSVIILINTVLLAINANNAFNTQEKVDETVRELLLK